jgi:hypothetical protein
MQQTVNSKQRLKFFFIVFVCLLPVLAGYALYFFWKPSSFNNYGELIQPQRSTKALALTDLQGKAVAMEQFRKRFVMVTVAPSECDSGCVEQLYTTRQLRTMQGKDRERVDRLWIISNSTGVPAASVLDNQDGLVVARADPAALAQLFPVAPGNQLQDHVYLIDYQGNLMMRFPKKPDPYKIKKDLSILLRAASVR